ncbi:hypothetical protein Sjap_007769 [Stephania japonica]|uniref:Uncharacterized protein n=1 Tax=Stephania japonica TaxID=461633 RepID=A0AAP0JQG5_9MAGN
MVPHHSLQPIPTSLPHARSIYRLEFQRYSLLSPKRTGSTIDDHKKMYTTRMYLLDFYFNRINSSV